jgi:hypothetical protein
MLRCVALVRTDVSEECKLLARLNFVFPFSFPTTTNNRPFKYIYIYIYMCVKILTEIGHKRDNFILYAGMRWMLPCALSVYRMRPPIQPHLTSVVTCMNDCRRSSCWQSDLFGSFVHPLVTTLYISLLTPQCRSNIFISRCLAAAFRFTTLYPWLPVPFRTVSVPQLQQRLSNSLPLSFIFQFTALIATLASTVDCQLWTELNCYSRSLI